MKRTRGVALLMAVLVVALATLLIAGLLDRGLIGQARALQHTRSSQAYAFQQGLELWAARILRDDAERDGIDARTDVWAQPLPPITVPEGLINGVMRDLDGCLNLNALWTSGQVNALAQQRFERLLRVLEIDPRVLMAIIDWLDADDFAGSGGGEDAAYAALDPPRRAANAPFVHVSELRAVLGITPAIYDKLAAHVCARSDADSTININTATAQVLMSLDEGIAPALARRLHNDGRARFASVDPDFIDTLTGEGLVIAPGFAAGLGVRSRYFVAEAQILLAEVPVRLYSVLERRADGRIRVLARSQGRF